MCLSRDDFEYYFLSVSQILYRKECRIHIDKQLAGNYQVNNPYPQSIRLTTVLLILFALLALGKLGMMLILFPIFPFIFTFFLASSLLLQEHLRNSPERILDLLSSLGRSLHIPYIRMRLQESLYCLHGYFPLVGKIGLIADEEDLGLWGTGLLYLLEPVGCGILVRLDIGDIEDYHQGMCALVVGTCYCPEFLLACSVPDLELDTLAAQHERLESEINSDCGEEGITEIVICVTDHYGGFAHAAVPHQYYFEQMEILSFVHAHL